MKGIKMRRLRVTVQLVGKKKDGFAWRVRFNHLHLGMVEKGLKKRLGKWAKSVYFMMNEISILPKKAEEGLWLDVILRNGIVPDRFESNKKSLGHVFTILVNMDTDLRFRYSRRSWEERKRTNPFEDISNCNFGRPMTFESLGKSLNRKT